MTRVEDMMQKMMRRFDASYERTKELRNGLAGIGKKVDTHAISINILELQMAQLSVTVNTHQQSTLPNNTVKNTKNDGHCMAITTLGGEQTIDQHIPSGIEKVIRDDDTVVKVSSEIEDKMAKHVHAPKKVSKKDRGW